MFKYHKYCGIYHVEVIEDTQSLTESQDKFSTAAIVIIPVSIHADTKHPYDHFFPLVY
jgi:hypothetical protein